MGEHEKDFLCTSTNKEFKKRILIPFYEKK